MNDRRIIRATETTPAVLPGLSQVLRAQPGGGRAIASSPGDLQWERWQTVKWSGTPTPIRQPFHRSLSLDKVSALVVKTYLQSIGPSASAKLNLKAIGTPDSPASLVVSYPLPPPDNTLGLKVQFISLEGQQSPNMRQRLTWDAEGAVGDSICFRFAVARTGTVDSGPIQSVIPRATGPIVPIGRNLFEFQPTITANVGWNTGESNPLLFALSPDIQWLLTGGYRRVVVETEIFQLNTCRLWLMAGNDPGGYWGTTEVTATGITKFSLSDAGTSSLLSILRWGISTNVGGGGSACFRMRARVE